MRATAAPPAPPRRRHITIGSGQDTIVAGAGSDQVTAGSGNDTITLAGWSNTLSLGGGTDTVNAGSGDTITINSTNRMLKGGTQEMVFLGSGVTSVTDLSMITVFVATTASGSADLFDLANDPSFVLDLRGGVGGYNSTASIVNALQSDGHGGMQLMLGSMPGAPIIDFENAARTMLTSGHFKIE